MRFVDIKIFNVARTTVDRDAVKQWLDFIGADQFEVPGPDVVSDPALLVALAAKNCYRSFQPSLNPNLTKVRTDLVDYLDNILKSGHGCYDAETEVLTESGWKFWPEVTERDLLATRSENGQLEYHLPTRIVEYQHTGRMYRVDSAAVDLLVTDNHNMLVCQMTTARGRKKLDYKLVKATELGHRQHAYIRTASWERGESFPVAVSKLLGFAIGDGSMSVSGNSLRFHLRRERKISYLLEVAKDAEFDCHTGESGDTFTVKIPDRYLSLFRAMYDDNREKVIPEGFIVSKNRRALEGLYDGLMNSDGSRSDCGDLYDTTSEKLAGQVQQLCLHVGIASNISQAPSYGDRSGSLGDKPIHRVQIGRRSLKPEVNKPGLGGTTSWVEDWVGTVYCAEVPNHTLYVRRNGKTVWCGNSVLEHAVYTFTFENVSRVFTGEMNRHRAGVGISECSMRYVRFTDIPMWKPRSITLTPDEENLLRTVDYSYVVDGDITATSVGALPGAPTDPAKLEQLVLAIKKSRTCHVFKEHGELVEQHYAMVQRIWSQELAPTSKFHLKKQITSMMRRIVPMGVATGGTWTFNLRAMRHIIALRASQEAEEEIAYVFGLVGKLMHEKEPAIFGDFTQTTDGFWVPKYPKV